MHKRVLCSRLLFNIWPTMVVVIRVLKLKPPARTIFTQTSNFLFLFSFLSIGANSFLCGYMESARDRRSFKIEQISFYFLCPNLFWMNLQWSSVDRGGLVELLKLKLSFLNTFVFNKIVNIHVDEKIDPNWKHKKKEQISRCPSIEGNKNIVDENELKGEIWLVARFLSRSLTTRTRKDR